MTTEHVEQPPPVSRDEIATVTRERDMLLRSLTALVRAAEEPRDEWHRGDWLGAWDQARQLVDDLDGNDG